MITIGLQMKKIVLLFLLSSISCLYADWTDKVTINGYFNFEYENKISGDEDVKKASEHASFDSDMIDIVLNVQATQNVRVAVDFTWEHGTQSESDKGNVGYEYAFAEYTFSDQFKIRTGKMFTPFGIYNEIHTAKPSFMIVKEPNSTNKMYYISDDNYEQIMLYPRWETGIALLGNYEIGDIPIDYIIQVANGDILYGSGGNEYEKDDNDYKAVTGRIRASLTDNLEIGVSFHHDVMTNYISQETLLYVAKDTLGNDINVTSTEKIPDGTITVDSQGAQIIWHFTDEIRLEAEYMTGTLKVDGMPSFRRSGYSILPSYSISDKINLFFLYAKADPNHSVDNNSVVNYSPGINVEVAENAFFKLDFFTVKSESANSLYNGLGYTETRAAFAVGF